MAQKSSLNGKKSNDEKNQNPHGKKSSGAGKSLSGASLKKSATKKSNSRKNKKPKVTLSTKGVVVLSFLIIAFCSILIALATLKGKSTSAVYVADSYEEEMNVDGLAGEGAAFGEGVASTERGASSEERAASTERGASSEERAASVERGASSEESAASTKSSASSEERTLSTKSGSSSEEKTSSTKTSSLSEENPGPATSSDAIGQTLSIKTLPDPFSTSLSEKSPSTVGGASFEEKTSSTATSSTASEKATSPATKSTSSEKAASTATTSISPEKSASAKRVPTSTEKVATAKSTSSSQEAPCPYKIPQAKNGATLVFVIDDAGQNVSNVKKYATLPFPITIAVLPKLSHSKDAAYVVRSNNKELILHQPMQAGNLNLNPGPAAIKPGMSDAEIAALVKENLEELGPNVKGLNNHEGSLITENLSYISAVLTVAKEKEIYFLDSRTTSKTQAPQAAMNLGVTIKERDVFIDDIVDRDEMLFQIYRGLDIANKKGKVIMIGHVDKSVNILPDLLRDMEPYLRAKGYTFSTPSQIK